MGSQLQGSGGRFAFAVGVVYEECVEIAEYGVEPTGWAWSAEFEHDNNRLREGGLSTEWRLAVCFERGRGYHGAGGCTANALSERAEGVYLGANPGYRAKPIGTHLGGRRGRGSGAPMQRRVATRHELC